MGSLPLFLPGVIGVDSAAQQRELETSVLAGTAVHEIRAWGEATELADSLWQPLYDFGYGRDDTVPVRALIPSGSRAPVNWISMPD